MQAQQTLTKTANGLEIAPDLYLPIETITSRNAFFGISGSGKTYTSLVLAEEMQKIDSQFVIIDPLGVAWGLRVPINPAPKQTAIRNEVYIFGGEHQDLPLDPAQGAVVADLVVARKISVILDLSQFDDDEARALFVADFARQMLYINRSPIHIFVDEADLFAPQQTDTKGEFACRKAMDNLVRRGRVKGIGVSLISQRPAVVAKNLLTQITLLIVHQLTGRSDLDAVKGWIRDHGTDEQLRSALESLPKLKAGQAIVWKPGGDMPIYEQTQIRRRRTFDSSATPEFGIAPVTPERLQPLDLEALREELGRAIEQAEETDPEALRRLVAEQKKQLADRPKAEPVEKIVYRERIVEKPVLTGEALIMVQALRELAAGLSKDMPPFLSLLGGLVRDYSGDGPGPVPTASETLAERAYIAQVEIAAPELPAPTVEVKGEPVPVPVPEPIGNPDTGLTDSSPSPTVPTVPKYTELKLGAQRILAVLGAHPDLKLTEAQVGTRAKLTMDGGGARTAVRQLKDYGLISRDLGVMGITSHGMTVLGNNAPKAPESAEELVAMWREAIGRRPTEVLEILIDQRRKTGAGLSAAELAATLGLDPEGGSFRGYLRMLVSQKLADKRGNQFVAADGFFAFGR